MEQYSQKPEDLFKILLKLNACVSIEETMGIVRSAGPAYFGWRNAELRVDTHVNVTGNDHSVTVELRDPDRRYGVLVYDPGHTRNDRPLELDLFFSALTNKLGKLRLAECCQEQTIELERCRHRIDSIVNDLNAIEQIKANFISIASHELRTPLTVTRGYVEMLLEDEQLGGSQKETLNGVYKGVLKQAEILDSLFELAKFDTVSPVLNQERVWVGKLTREILKKLTKPIQERGIQVEVNSVDDQSVCVDAASIRKLLLNLIQNAIKFTPDNGRVRVDITAVEMANEDEILRPGVLISIRDAGVGIDREQLEVIFTRFYQPKEKLATHSSGKTKFKGSGLGLGLALSKAITLAHNGKIWAESEGYNEETMPGSVFHVFLPAKK